MTHIRVLATMGLSIMLLGSGPAPAQESAKLVRAHVFCSLYGQHPSGRNWQFYISQVGEIQTGYGEAWPDSPRDPISKRWGEHLRQQGIDIDQYARGQNPKLPTCYGSNNAEEAQKTRDRHLSDVRKGSGGYTVHELPWRPSGVNQ